MKPQPCEQEAFYISWVEESVRRSHQITRDETMVGRASDCDIRINNQQISRHHLRIVRSGGTFTLFDLNSRLGTFLRGEKVTECVLKVGDSIGLGSDRVPVLFTNDATAFPGDSTAWLESSIFNLK